MKLSRLALAVALAPSLTLAAEPASDDIAPLVITRATPLEQPAPASVRVIKRAEIERSGAHNLIDVLRGQAGVQLRDIIGDGSRATPSLRGFGENAVNNTLILVDGRRLNQPAMAGADLNSVPLANIERIEILRGAGTVLYGDQAVGGVINIVTRTPRRNEAYVETSRGSHDLEAYRGHVFQQLGGGFSVYASGEARHTDNYRDHNAADYGNAFGRLRYDHARGWALYEYQTVDDELLYPGALSLAQRRSDRKQSQSTDWNDSNTQVHRFAVEQRLDEIWTANFDYSHSDQDGVGSFFGGGFSQGTRIESFSPRLTARWDTARGHSEWLLGHDHITSDYQASWGSDFRQTLRDWYTQFSQPLGHDLTLSLGYRASEAEDRDHSAGSNHTDREGSSSVGLSWQADAQTRVFLKREDVLRWANVDENGFVGPGVEFLKPQTGASWEGGVEWDDGAQRYQLSVYRLDLDDELMYDATATGPFGPGTGANVNLDKTRRDGLLLEARRQLTERLALGGQYSFTDSEYRTGPFAGNEVPGVSRHSASAHLDYLLLPGLNGRLEALYTGGYYLYSDDAHSQPREGGYTLLNAALSYDYRQLTARLRINNLTGKQYDTYANPFGRYPAPEEDVQLSVGYRF
ncbi:TonB-dependent receptor [Pseudomonas sp. OF001]|uniref:TonB-dependent receptor n=1 Tax=unclassified Pseudomonas TaxID=196821 RepID=UPI001919A7F6|nr:MULTISPECIES: TonB-dependent receptor [unclassified Pseudomonas]WPP44335.1 TonB-dependent receptor [Pseudomonas sp. AN-1]CAD5376309.1 TonB-dependent receptor [Pseudomonas sp. OF001]